MSKTPFEIRLDLLRLAKESLFEPYYAQRSSVEMKWHADREAKLSVEFPAMPVPPSTEDVIAEAKKLNEFISNCDK